MNVSNENFEDFQLIKEKIIKTDSVFRMYVDLQKDNSVLKKHLQQLHKRYKKTANDNALINLKNNLNSHDSQLLKSTVEELNVKYTKLNDEHESLKITSNSNYIKLQETLAELQKCQEIVAKKTPVEETVSPKKLKNQKNVQIEVVVSPENNTEECSSCNLLKNELRREDEDKSKLVKDFERKNKTWQLNNEKLKKEVENLKRELGKYTEKTTKSKSTQTDSIKMPSSPIYYEKDEEIPYFKHQSLPDLNFEMFTDESSQTIEKFELNQQNLENNKLKVIFDEMRTSLLISPIPHSEDGGGEDKHELYTELREKKKKRLQTLLRIKKTKNMFWLKRSKTLLKPKRKENAYVEDIASILRNLLEVKRARKSPENSKNVLEINRMLLEKARLENCKILEENKSRELPVVIDSCYESMISYPSSISSNEPPQEVETMEQHELWQPEITKSELKNDWQENSNNEPQNSENSKQKRYKTKQTPSIISKNSDSSHSDENRLTPVLNKDVVPQKIENLKRRRSKTLKTPSIILEDSDSSLSDENQTTIMNEYDEYQKIENSKQSRCKIKRTPSIISEHSDSSLLDENLTPRKSLRRSTRIRQKRKLSETSIGEDEDNPKEESEKILNDDDEKIETKPKIKRNRQPSKKTTALFKKSLKFYKEKNHIFTSKEEVERPKPNIKILSNVLLKRECSETEVKNEITNLPNCEPQIEQIQEKVEQSVAPIIEENKALITKKQPRTGGFKRPNISRIIPACPASPPPETPEITPEPLIIPLEKPQALKPKEALDVFRELLTFPKEDKIVDKVTAKLSTQEAEHISTLVLEQILSDKEKASLDNENPGAPLLTDTQRVLYGLMLNLESSISNMSGLIEIYLSKAELKLFQTKSLQQIENLARIHVAICKSRSEIHRMRKVCSDSFYFMGDLCVPFLFIVLVSWIEILPKHDQCEKFPLAKVIVQLVQLKTCNIPGYNLIPLRNLLNKYYEYPSERWDTETFFKQLFTDYLKNPVRPSDYAILLYCKNNESKWVCDKITNVIKPVFEKVTNENFKATLILLMSNILSQLKGSEKEHIDPIKEWFKLMLSDGNLPEVVEQSILLGIKKMPKPPKKKKKGVNLNT